MADRQLRYIQAQRMWFLGTYKLGWSFEKMQIFKEPNNFTIFEDSTLKYLFKISETLFVDWKGILRQGVLYNGKSVPGVSLSFTDNIREHIANDKRSSTKHIDDFRFNVSS